VIFKDACHCGTIGIEFETATDPAATDVRACQCSFCRKHNALAVSDPDGKITIRIRAASRLSRYEFGLRTATYVVCAQCGVYVASITNDGSSRAIAIVTALDDAARFTRPPRPVDYDSETRADRLLRRQRRWTPATLIMDD